MAPTSLSTVRAALAQVDIYSPRNNMLLCPLLQVFTFSISFHTRSYPFSVLTGQVLQIPLCWWPYIALAPVCPCSYCGDQNEGGGV